MTQADTDTNLTRVTFNLVPRAVTDLETLTSLTGLSKTDVLNRAVQVYRLVEDLRTEHGGLRVQTRDGSIERIYVL